LSWTPSDAEMMLHGLHDTSRSYVTLYAQSAFRDRSLVIVCHLSLVRLCNACSSTRLLHNTKSCFRSTGLLVCTWEALDVLRNVALVS